VENLIQAGKRRLTITAVPIRTNLVERPSRLHRGNWNFIKRQSAIIARTYTAYEPLKVFSYIALAFFIPGVLLLLRAAYVYIGRNFGLVADNLQSLQMGSLLMMMALITFLIGLLADRVGGVRRVQEEILYRVRSMQVEDDAWRRGVTARLDQIERDLRDEPVSRPEG
jgi:hypothetical protein